MKKRIGLLGGSFDPIHVGHINLARSAKELLNLDEVQLIPVYQSSEKTLPKASGLQRAEMLNLAISSTPELVLNLTEIRRKKISYTIDTVQSLSEKSDYFWIMGSDQFVNFSSWQRWREIFDCIIGLGIAHRSGYLVEKIDPIIIKAAIDHCCSIQFIPVSSFVASISSSEIRARIALKQSVKKLLPKLVMDYIFHKNLYTS